MSSGAGAYVARWGARAFLWPTLILVMTVPAVVWGWRDLGGAWFVIVVFLVAAAVITVQAVRRTATGAVAFAVEERGVYLGEDENRRTAWWSWGDIDAVVHFRFRHPGDEGSRGAVSRYVGVMRGGQVVDSRRVQGWRLDPAGLAAATGAHGAGTPVVELPEQRGRIPGH